MSFRLENLSPDRFQKLCQSLVACENSDVQCFPLNQADGGRDATSTTPSNEFVVFQVKHSSRPDAIVDRSTWIVYQIKSEASKVQKLAKKGAVKFVLITNVPGTGPLESGSIDKGAQALQDLPLPSQVWWQDDILRRLDLAPQLKWLYPEGMAGDDMLQSLLAGATAGREGQTRAIRSYLEYQYRQDKEVRFRQVDLHNDLADLYVDVPLAVSGQFEFNDFEHGGRGTLAAEYIFGICGQGQFVIIEGGPGQGKSTVSQYVSQTYRAYLLQKPDSKRLRQ
ncbi:MAG: hypothetical protein EOP10_31180, partial [Proteobacteria bacterium]